MRGMASGESGAKLEAGFREGNVSSGSDFIFWHEKRMNLMSVSGQMHELVALYYQYERRIHE